VTDDEPGMRLGVARALKDFTVSVPDAGGVVRFEVEAADSGEQALAKIEARPPHILLLDYKLPGISGLEVLDRLHDRFDILTIMITAYASLDTAVTAIKHGAYDFLAKPFTPDELRYALRKATSQLILSKQALKLAEEKRQVRFNFISVLAHELKAPLNAVEGYLNILRTTEEDQNLQMVERSIVRVDGMKKLIGDLLDLTRIESGQRERVIKRLDLAELARTSMELFAVDAERHGITMQVEADRDVELNADPGEVEIVFNNLVSNAVKYNRDGGTVTVKLSRKDDAVRISVSDTGIGLRPEEAAKLFNEFTRIKNEHTVKILGSGLGLSTVRKIANMYDGEAEVRSEPGEGSTFTVTLHDAPAESGRPAAADTSTSATAVPPA
jgi:signal transduction histidine kinase